MSREHARLRVDIMGDDDFRDLTPAAQHLYFLLLIDAKLSYCGVADWRPARIAARAKGWTAEAVVEAARELAEGLFLVVDDAAEEVLVRSFVKHDGLMKNPRMAVSMMLAYAGVESRELRGVIVFEVAKLRANQPDLSCWDSKYSGEKLRQMLRRESIDPADFPTGFRAVSGSVSPEVSGSVSPEVNPQVKGSVYPKPTPNVYPKVYGSTTPAPTPTPAPSTSNEVLDDVRASEPIDAEVVDADGFDYPADLLQAAEATPTPAAPAPEKKSPRGHVCPDDWWPRDTTIEWAQREHPNVNWRDEVGRMRDWSQGAPGSKGLKRDWNAAFRNWVRTASERQQDRTTRAAGPRTFRERQFEEARGRIVAGVAAGAPDPFSMIEAALGNGQQAIGGVA